MDLTLFIVFVIMIISFIYFIQLISALKSEVTSLKSTCSLCVPNNSKSAKVNDNKEIIDKIKEVFLNYIRNNA